MWREIKVQPKVVTLCTSPDSVGTQACCNNCSERAGESAKHLQAFLDMRSKQREAGTFAAPFNVEPVNVPDKLQHRITQSKQWATAERTLPAPRVEKQLQVDSSSLAPDTGCQTETHHSHYNGSGGMYLFTNLLQPFMWVFTADFCKISLLLSITASSVLLLFFVYWRRWSKVMARSTERSFNIYLLRPVTIYNQKQCLKVLMNNF